MQRCSSACGHSSRTAFHRPGAPSATDQPRRVHSAAGQVAAEGEPVLVALARAELQPEQDLSALQRHAPGDQDPLGRRVVGVQLQIDRVEEQVHEVVLLELALAPAAVALAGVLQHARHCRLRDHRLIERLRQRGLDVAHREAAQERADHQCLQRVGARDALANDPRLEAQLGRVADSRPLDLHRPRGRPHRLRPLIPVAMRDRCLGALVAGAAEELGQLVLERLLDDQPGAKPTDLLDRIRQLTGITDQRRRARGATARSGLLSYPSGRTSCVVVTGQSGGYAQTSFPRLLGRHRRPA